MTKSLWHISTDYRADTAAERDAIRGEHLSFLLENKDTVHSVGARIDEEGYRVGGEYLLDVPDLEAARAFIERDPYSVNGHLAEVRISAFGAAILNHTSLID